MAENLREVIARMKSQNSQKLNKSVEAKPKQEPVMAVSEFDDGEEDEDIEDDEDEENETEQVVQETPKAKERAVENKVNSKNTENTEDQSVLKQQREILQQIEALQNSGVFRMELLGQLQEINKALVVIAGIMADLSNEKGK